MSTSKFNPIKSSTTMDPFQKLPVEIHLNILILINNLKLYSSLSRASPAIFKV